MEGRVLVDGYWLTPEDAEQYKSLKEKAAYWNRIQHVRKIFLNSTYGALLNAFFRFSDPRFGQSVTLSGRVVTKHMARKANEIIEGKYDFGDSIIYGDTDSCYVTIYSLVKALAEDLGVETPKVTTDTDLSDEFIDSIVNLCDEIGDVINASFPEEMDRAFFVGEERGAIIKAGREIVASRGLFKDAKKRYALGVVDKEGQRKHKLKVMGMETQRTDTPKFVQDFLKGCLKEVVQNAAGESKLKDLIDGFREEFRKRDPWTLGRPGRVSNLSRGSRLRVMYEDGYDPEFGDDDDDMLDIFSNSPSRRKVNIENPRIHFTVTAADNTNRYIEFHDDHEMDKIRDGDKVEVIDLLKDPVSNPLALKSVAVPVGVTRLPDWFKKLPFDVKTAEEKLIDKKIENVFGILKMSLDRKEHIGEELFH